MIHPSTMAGPTWFPGSFGTTNPFQQNTQQLFRSTPFQGPQVGFGIGTTPFQGQPIQSAIDQIVRQTLPGFLGNIGIQPTVPFQSPIGFQTPVGLQGQFGIPSPFGIPGVTDFQNPQAQGYALELVRQVTNQALQNLYQQSPTPYGQPFLGLGTTPFTGVLNQFGGGPQQEQQRQFLNFVCQVCNIVAACCEACLVQQTQTQGVYGGFSPQQEQQRQFLNLCCQVCRTVATCCQICLVQLSQGQSVPLNVLNTPFATNNITSQFGVTPGIPAGVGAF